MKLVKLKCPSCNANLEINTEMKKFTCNYCGTTTMLDDEVQHVKYDDMEQAGYDFEMGKMKARQDFNNQKYNSQVDANNKKNNLVLVILGWLCFPIFMATYYIAKSNRLEKKTKIILIVIIWGVLFLYYVSYLSMISSSYFY